MPSVGDLGTLAVTLGAKTTEFRKDLRDARGDLADTESGMRSLVNSAGKLGVAVIAAGGALVAGLVHAGLEAIDAQAKLARQLDGTIDGLRGLEIAAQDAGVGQAELESSMRALNARIGEAQRQAGPARDMFNALGLSAASLSKLDVDQRMSVIADRVHDLGLSASQTADLLRTLGVRSGEMVDFMRQGGDAIRSARKVDDFGLSVSEVDAAKVEAANDALERVGRMLEGVRNQFAIALAPILQEVAERISNLVKANGGWAESTRAIVEGGIRGFSKVADVIQGLRVALKAAELIGWGFAAAVVSVTQLAAEGFVAATDVITGQINVIIDALNELPHVDIARIDTISDSAFMQGIRKFADEVRDKVGTARDELHDMAMQELPSARVEAFFQAIQDKAQTAAEAVVKVRHEAAAAAEDAKGFAVEEDPAVKKQREQLEQRLQSVRESVASEVELEQMRYAERAKILEEALANELITVKEYDQIRADLEVQHMTDLVEARKKAMSDLEKFTSMSFRQQTASVIGALVNMTAGVSQQSRAMFELNKAAGIANAIVSTAEGVTKALAAYPPPLSFIMAGAQAAAGLAQVQAIRATTFGGGGSAPSLAGGTAAPPVSNVGPGQAANQTPARQTIALEGISEDQLFSGKSVRGLIKRLQEAQADGAVLVLD